MKTRSITTGVLLRAFFLAGLLSLSLQGISQNGGGTFVAGPLMNRTRIEPFLATLSDGRVAAFGGRESGFISCEYADFYSPAANTFTEIPMNFPHDNSYAVKLFDGRYYIIGGSMSLGVAPGYPSCEIFDPAANTFTTAGSMDYARMWMVGAQLNNGNILIAGAWYDNTAAGVGEYYDTASHTYTLTNAVVVARSNPLMLPTTDGGAILFGGCPPFGGSVYTSVEYYSPSDNSFHSVSSELMPSDPGWLVTGTPFHRRPYADFRMSNGNYLIGASKPGEYALLSFDPEAKSFTRISTAAPLMDAFTNGGFYDIVLNKTANVAYLLGVDSGFDPLRISVVQVNLTTGQVYHPGTTFTLPASEYLYPSIAYMPSNGKILLEGVSSTTGDYFHATDKSYIITPSAALETGQIAANDLNAVCYPNPATDQVNFKLATGQTGSLEVRIYDILGRTIENQFYTSAPSVISLPVRNLPAGMYFYEIRNNTSIVRDRFIKE